MEYYFEGSATDPIFAVIVLTIFTIGLVVAFYLAQAFSAANPAIFGSVMGEVTSALQIFTTGAILVFVGMNALAIVAAWFVRAHPIFALANLLIMFIAAIIANVAVNIVQDFFMASYFVGIVNVYLGALVVLFKILPLATIVFSILIMVFQYAKPVGGTV